MDYLEIFTFTALGGILLFFIQSALVKAPGQSLNQKFVSLGTLKGKTLDEITAVCGKPNAVSAIGEGKVLRQWQATGYHIALIFDSNGVCEGISSEISV